MSATIRSVFSAMVAASCLSTAARANIDVLAWSGELLPHASTSYRNFFEPVLNNAGQVAVVSELMSVSFGSSDSAVLQLTRTSRSVLAKSHAAAAEPNTTFLPHQPFAQPSQSNTGHVAFFAGFADESDASQRGLFLFKNGNLNELVRRGDLVPDGSGTFQLLAGTGFNGAPTINDHGQVGFRSGIEPGGYTQNDGMFVASESGVQLIAKIDPTNNSDLAANRVRYFEGAGDSQAPAINNSQQVALAAGVKHPMDSSPWSYVLQAEIGSSGLSAVHDPGNPIHVPGTLNPMLNGGGSPNYGTGVSLNESGQTVFRALRRDDTYSWQIVRTTPAAGGTHTRAVIAHQGNTAPLPNGGSGVFYSIDGAWALNDAGQVLYTAGVGSSVTQYIANGLFIGDGDATVPIAFQGQAVPDGDGTFRYFNAGDNFAVGGQFALNNAGQVAFAAEIESSAPLAKALFYWDELDGLTEIVRTGDPFMGSLLTNFYFSGSANERGLERSGFNDLGEVAFSFNLADGRSGVAIWSVPEPSGIAVFSLCAAALFRRVRR